MCGILGSFHREAGSHTPLTQVDLSRLQHRGPDGNGIYSNEYVQLGHTRLAIIDLSPAGSQPMATQDERFVVTFNGEIYNYPELRSELEILGETFTTQSDTEVLLSAYRRWGPECVKRFRGMFAFALWDDLDKSLFLARDRSGERPLFYGMDENRFVFASELKALVPLLNEPPVLNPAVVDMYLHYQYVPEPFTLLKGIQKLPAAHTLLVSLKHWRAEPKRFWDIEKISPKIPLPEDEAGILKCVRDGLEDAVKMTLRADVPVAVALSGGIDSGAIAALAQKHYPEPMHAFCVGYPGRPPYDERNQARALAESLGMIVHEVELPVESFVSFFPELVRIMDEPIADPAAFGHYSVPKAAAEQGIKVLLTGIGRDEVFWGYDWVRQSAAINEKILTKNWLPRINHSGLQDFIKRFTNSSRFPNWTRDWASLAQGLVDTKTPQDQLLFYMLAPDFGEAFNLKKQIGGDALRSLSDQNPFIPTEIGPRTQEQIPAAVIRLLFDTWLVSNALALGDRVSMGVSVECRLPFLDVKLIELAMALRARVPDHRLGQKAWLRAALKGVLPDEVLARPKSGFQPPVHEWLTGVVNRYGEFLEGGNLVKAGILTDQTAKEALSKISKQCWPGLFFVYKLVLLEMWYRKVVL